MFFFTLLFKTFIVKLYPGRIDQEVGMSIRIHLGSWIRNPNADSGLELFFLMRADLLRFWVQTRKFNIFLLIKDVFKINSVIL